MPPSVFREVILDPGLSMLARFADVSSDDRARVLALAIAGQESAWEFRRQLNGPARGFWQFERGGGTRGVMKHHVSAPRAMKLCIGLSVPASEPLVFEALAWSDYLSVGFARLLLLTDPRPLPDVGDEDTAWDYYVRNWRPGRPHPETWPIRYRASMDALKSRVIS